MMDFQTRAERGCRSYRDVIADGQAQLERPAAVACPACGYEPTADGLGLPVGLPERDEAGREARRLALQPTARRLAERLRRRVSDGTFAIWLAPLVLDDATSDALFLSTPAPLVDWTADRYGPLLSWAAEALAGRRMTIEIYAGGAGAATLGDLASAPEAIAA